VHRKLTQRTLAACAVAALASLVWLDSEAHADATKLGTITYIEGEALRAKEGAGWTSLRERSRVFQGDRLKTKKDSRLEATLADGSKLRLGANSELNLAHLSVGKKRKARKKVTAKLIIGRVWASVTSLFGSGSSFEVTTDNAVAGVRGTRFAAARSEDGTTTVKVYSGKVLVSNRPIYAVEGHTKGKRVEVPGPREVSKKQWEELVASAMQVVRVAADGEMTPPQSFEMASAGDDSWEAWNVERDKLAGLEE
jgi:hypothetical protein